MKAKKIRDAKREKTVIKRLFLWFIISVLACAILAVGIFLYFFSPRDGDMFILTVPSLVGMQEKDILPYPSITVERDFIYSSDHPKGEVISQEPYGGAKRKVRDGKKYTVKVYISLGEKTEQVPELAGVGEISAAAALRSIGAYVRSISIYRDGEDGQVLYTSPPSGSRIREGDRVTLFVARNRTEDPVTIPDFSGMEAFDAYALALSLGLFIEDPGESVSQEAVIAGQSIPMGAKVRQGCYISFTFIREEESTEREWPPVIFGGGTREDF